MSLASRFLITLLVSAALPLVAYGWFSLRGMRDHIDEQVVRVFLPQLAADCARKIEAHFERVDQTCAVVREISRRALESPAELAAFEEQIELVPDLLDNLLDLVLLVNPDGNVVYWQDGHLLDPDHHEHRAARMPRHVGETTWFRQAQQQRGTRVLPWGRWPWLFGGSDHRSMDPASHHLGITIDVPQREGPPGVLLALLRWGEVQRILDAARDVLSDRANLPSAAVMLVSRDGRIHAHTDRRLYGLHLEPAELADELVQARTSGRSAFRTATGIAGRSGFAPCGNDSNRDFVLGVTVPEDELFADSAAFELVLMLAIGLSLTGLCLWSLLASRAITAPVQALVEATRRVAGGDLEFTVQPRGGPELGELASSFNQMAKELATGREKLAAAQREQAWAEMARQVAHEVKNPLLPMRMSAQLLQRARREQDPRADHIADRLARTVLEQTESLDRIASDFRAFAGAVPGVRGTVRLDGWLHDLRLECESLHAGDELSLSFHPSAGETRVAIDQHAMRRVFVNLVRNAIEATPGPRHMQWHSATADGKAIVRVIDAGPGIPMAVRNRLFEPYFTTKSAGTGLGLAICRRLLEAQHGSIRLVRSEPGHTEFLLELPEQPASAVPPAAPGNPPA